MSEMGSGPFVRGCPPGAGADDAAARVRLSIGALAIDVVGDDPETLEWIAEFLAPAFSAQPLDSLPTNAAQAQHMVHFESAPADYARLQEALASAPLEELEAFTLDGSFSRHRGWDASDGRRWIYGKQHEAFYGIDPAARSVRVVGAEAGNFPVPERCRATPAR